MEQENDYFLECPYCDVEVEVFVQDQESPLFCPMCGEEVEWNAFDGEDDDEV